MITKAHQILCSSGLLARRGGYSVGPASMKTSVPTSERLQWFGTSDSNSLWGRLMR
jgi:hypothetical protein